MSYTTGPIVVSEGGCRRVLEDPLVDRADLVDEPALLVTRHPEGPPG